MGCEACATNGSGAPRGCKNNGTCSSGGCSKLGVFDWLANMDLPGGQSTYDIVEVRFKNSRKSFFRNLKDINIQVGDIVVVESSHGYDVGIVSITGELARIQVQKKNPGFKPHEARNILRKATQEDVEKWKEARSLESKTMFESRKIASGLGLDMKISDVEYQGDKAKATFYYTAEGRVDFRQLIKELADRFKLRIEMRQIGARQESARLGGIGSCGRELCCSTWLTDFRSVSTAAARYQQLSLNPQKLAGQCGKLKCCLNYELDMYLEAIKSFPETNIKLESEKGIAFHIKTDVFKRILWYAYEQSSGAANSGLIPLSPERVEEIIQLNKKGKKPTDLKDFIVDLVTEEEPDYTNVVGQDSLTRFEHVFKKKKKKKKRKKGNHPHNKGGEPNKGNHPQKGGGPNKGRRQPNKNNPKKGGNQPKANNKPQNNRDNQSKKPDK